MKKDFKFGDMLIVNDDISDFNKGDQVVALDDVDGGWIYVCAKGQNEEYIPVRFLDRLNTQ